MLHKKSIKHLSTFKMQTFQGISNIYISLNIAIHLESYLSRDTCTSAHIHKNISNVPYLHYNRWYRATVFTISISQALMTRGKMTSNLLGRRP